MSRRRKIRTNYKLPLAMDLLERLAPLLIQPGLFGMVKDGYQMRPSSGIWKKLDGTMTARFVYREPGDKRDSLVLSVRGIRADLLQAVK